MIDINSPIRAYSVWEYDEPRYEKTLLPKWELIVDPSDSMIIGGLFGIEEIRNQRDGRPWENWCAGTKFRHTKNGTVITIYEKVVYKNVSNRIIEVRETFLKMVRKSDQLELEM